MGYLFFYDETCFFSTSVIFLLRRFDHFSQLYSRGQKFKTEVDFFVRSSLFRSIASEIIRDCIILSGVRECDARDCFKS